MYRPRFGLRTLFVVVTLLAMAAGWIGYSLHWIRQRHAFLETNGWGVDANAPRGGSLPVYNGHGFLWMFGEPEFLFVMVRTGENPADDERRVSLARRLFPEAQVSGPTEP